MKSKSLRKHSKKVKKISLPHLILAGVLLSLGGFFLYRSLITTPSINITSDTFEDMQLATKASRLSVKERQKAKKNAKAGLKQDMAKSADIKSNQILEYRIANGIENPTKTILTDPQNIKLADKQNFSSNMTVINNQIELVSKTISTCQKAGKITSTDLGQCFCKQVSCTSGAGKNILSAINKYGDNNLSTKKPKDSPLVLECVEFVNYIIYGSLVVTGTNGKTVNHSVPLCSNSAAHLMGPQCFIEKGENSTAGGNWYYCNVKSNTIMKNGDILVFPQIEQLAGHLAVASNCPTEGGNSSTCQMTDSNFNFDGLVMTHSIKDYKKDPVRILRYDPNGNPDLANCTNHKTN